MTVLHVSICFCRLLFQNEIKELVIFCVNSPLYEHWTLSIIEFITLLYKDPVHYSPGC